MKKVIGILICTALLLVLAPISVLADAHTIDAGGSYDLATLGLADGDTISIAAGLTVTLIGDTATTYTNIKIECKEGVNLTLENVNINNSANNDTCALSFTGAGNSLTIEGENTLKSGNSKAGISVGTGTELTINGTGSLTTQGGASGAGIGGGFAGAGGTVNIYNGTVTAIGGNNGAGIGGGFTGAGGTVSINGGAVIATGGEHGAGIGGGYTGAGGTVTINGGAVIATGGEHGAGIGGGYIGKAGTVTISGGTVEATSGERGAGIGGGYDGAGGMVYISGGSVNATAGGGGAEDIGHGDSNANSGTLKNKSVGEGGVDVFLTTVILDSVTEATVVSSLTTDASYTYGTNDTETDDTGTLYLYLPAGTLTTAGKAGTVNYKAKSGEIETKDDGTATGILYISPTVIATAPSGTGAATAGDLTITFDRAMDSAIGEVKLNGNALAAGSWTDTQNYKAPYSGLTHGTDYTVEVSGFTDSNGIEMDSDTSHSFTTLTSSDATLSDLVISQGTLTPSFADDTYTYTTSVGNSVSSLSVTPTANDTNATITVNGMAVASGAASSDIALSVGENTVTILVTAQDGITMQTYTITITRAASGGGSSTPHYYTIGASADPGGKISPSGNVTVRKGQSQTFTITPDEGYKIMKVEADGKSLGIITTYTFENISQAHTIKAFFAAVEVPMPLEEEKKNEESEPLVLDNPFTDIAEGDWFYDDVLYVCKNGIMVGVSPQLFAPDTPLTRGMFVTLLYRLSGESAIYENPFSDVAAGAWYENAAAWATAKRICQGIGDGLFAPEQEISREQLAVMLYNYAKYQGYDLSRGEDTNILSYNDALNISEYAFAALQWACAMELIQGDGEGNLNPTGQATRAETAAILQRFLK
jgi:hypothetical protein